MVVEKILGEECARDMFYASAVTGMLTEKQASDMLEGIVKEAQRGKVGFGADLAKRLLDLVQKGIVGISGEGVKLLKNSPSMLGRTMALGAGLGSAGALAYDAMKENLSQEDPDAKFNMDLEALYNGRAMEAADAKWMDRVRSMRDELKRGWKKMTPEEYAGKYDALVSALKERMKA